MAADPTTLQPVCPALHRPEALFDPAATVHGLRAAQTRLAAGQRILDVWLYQDPPAGLAAAGVWRLEPSPGGASVAIANATIAAAPAPHLELALAGAPDPARYRLLLDPPAGVVFDPLRTWLAVRLLPECPDLGSCFDPPPVAAVPAASPVHDYLARDWPSLRTALVEYLLRRDPEADLSIADPTIALIELFAHAGDLLHYRLDRVATEAYLETARRRTSVRRHARLVDFPLREATAATTTVLVEVPPLAADVTVTSGEVAGDHAGSPLAFTLDADLTARAPLGEIPIYDFGEEACCLAEGASECVLVRPTPADALGPSWLRAGDLLVFEVVDPLDRDAHSMWATRRQDWPVVAPAEAFRAPLSSRTAQVVRLTAVEAFQDPLLGAGLTLAHVRWRSQDALRRAYPVGIDAGAGADEVTVARGNLVAAHHGRLVDGPPGVTLAPLPRVGEDPASTQIGQYSLVAAGSPASNGRPAGPGLALRDDGRPHLLEVGVGLVSGATVPAQQVANLLDPDAAGADFAYVVDTEEDEPPVMRFRTGSVGAAPPLASVVGARYEAGGGDVGNVPANALSVLERNESVPGAVPAWVVREVAVRNPVAASGGGDRMPLEVVRRDAPELFVLEPERAVLPVDHAAAAVRDPLVQRAMARRTWSGAWPLVETVVDLTVTGSAGDEARAALQARLDALRMIGTEVAVLDGTPIGLYIALEICASPGSVGPRIRADVLQALRPGSDERPGLFHPTRLVLGTAVYISTVVAAAAAIAGVDAVEVLEARRLDEPAGTQHEVLVIAPDEVAILDDDPAQPQRGRLDVLVRGAV